MVYVVVVVVGLVFGAADQYLGSRVTLGLWTSTVSAMSAPWVVVPFLVGWTQERARRAMALGLIVTAAALVGYFAMTYSPMEGVPTDRFFRGMAAVMTSGYNPLYIVGGLVTGPLYGWLGQRWRVDRSWTSAMLVAGALCLEPLARWMVGMLSPPALVWTTEVTIGAIVAACFVVVARRRSVGRTA
jgi:hypothetical protein